MKSVPGGSGASAALVFVVAVAACSGDGAGAGADGGGVDSRTADGKDTGQGDSGDANGGPDAGEAGGEAPSDSKADGTGGDAPSTDSADGGGGDGGGGESGMGACPTGCGPAGGSCCEALAVPGGMFNRFGDPKFPAKISPFVLDKYEVTVGRFRRYVETAAPDPAALKTALHYDLVFCTWTDKPGAGEARPINCTTRAEARAFCAWDGGDLPTEAQWMFAAMGGSEHRTFPWGLGTLTLRASYMDDKMNCVGDGMPGCAATDIVPVGSFPGGDGRWGHSDLAGNVAEMTLDYSMGAAASGPATCTDCTTSSGMYMDVHGGGFKSTTWNLYTWTRYPQSDKARSPEIGFRCARKAP